MLKKSAAQGYADAYAVFKVAAFGVPTPRFTPAAPIKGPGFLRGTLEHGKNLVSGLHGAFAGPTLPAGGGLPEGVHGPAFMSQRHKRLAADQALAHQQVLSSLKGLAPAAGMAGLGYLALRDSPEEKQMAAMKQQGMI